MDCGSIEDLTGWERGKGEWFYGGAPDQCFLNDMLPAGLPVSLSLSLSSFLFSLCCAQSPALVPISSVPNPAEKTVAVSFVPDLLPTVSVLTTLLTIAYPISSRSTVEGEGGHIDALFYGLEFFGGFGMMADGGYCYQNKQGGHPQSGLRLLFGYCV